MVGTLEMFVELMNESFRDGQMIDLQKEKLFFVLF